VRVENFEHWLRIEGYHRRARTGAAALDQGTAAKLACQKCGHAGLSLFAFERPQDGSYRAVAWCPQRSWREAVEI
jgi:hypothetical protein